MPNPINVTSQRINNSYSTTTVNTYVQADTQNIGTGTENTIIPDRDHVFLPVIGGTGQSSQSNLI